MSDDEALQWCTEHGYRVTRRCERLAVILDEGLPSEVICLGETLPEAVDGARLALEHIAWTRATVSRR